MNSIIPQKKPIPALGFSANKYEVKVANSSLYSSADDINSSPAMCYLLTFPFQTYGHHFYIRYCAVLLDSVTFHYI